MKKLGLTYYNLSPKEKSFIVDWVEGKKSTRQIAEELEMSHQNVINITCSIIRRMAQRGEIDFKKMMDRY